MKYEFTASPAKNRSHTRAKYSALLALILILSLILTLVFSKFLWQADLTGERIYTISEYTEETLDGLSFPINIYTLYSPGNDSKTLNGLLTTYSLKTPYLRIMNLESGILPADLKGLAGFTELPYGSVIVYCKDTGLYRTVIPSELYYEENGMEYFAGENKLTSAINYVSTGEEHKINLLYQHREKSTSDLSKVTDRLSRINIATEQYDLLSDKLSGENGELILCISPKIDLSHDEISKLRSFVNDGGTFLLTLDMAEYNSALGNVEKTDPELPNLLSFIEELGISTKNSIITDSDPKNTGMRPTVIEATAAKDAILGDAAGKQVVMSECFPLEITNSSDVRGLIYSSPTASGAEISTPYCLMAASRLGKGNVIVSSSSTIFTLTDSLSNSEVISEIICSCGLSGNNSIPSKPLRPENMNIEHGIIRILLAVFVMVLLPAAAIIAGANIISKRRS